MDPAPARESLCAGNMLPTLGAVVSERSVRLGAVVPGEEEERSGPGVQLSSSGSRYEGEFVQGLKHGRGRLTWRDGQFYDGSFYKEARHGDGVFCSASGEKFTGKFYLGREEGYGKHEFPDGSHFQGLYHVGFRLGPGVWSYPDGRQDVGLWLNKRLIQLCSSVGQSFSLRLLPGYDAYLDSSPAEEQRRLWTHTSFQHPENASRIVALLLARRARTDLLWSGHSPLSLAIASGNEMAVEELLKSGADPNLPLGTGVASALCALFNTNYNSCGNRQKLLDLLLKAGADMLAPVLVDGVEGTAVDFVRSSFNQFSRCSMC